MFGIGLPELIVIFIIALIVLGPDKLPQVVKQIARLVAELKKAGEEFKAQLDLEAVKDLKDIKKDITEDIKQNLPPGGLGPDWKPAGAKGSDAGAVERPNDVNADGDKPSCQAPEAGALEASPAQLQGHAADRPASDKKDVH